MAAPSDTPVDCSKLDEIIDDKGSAQSMTTLNDKYKLTTNLDDYMKKCKEIDESIKLLKEYNSKCHTSLTKQVFSAILRTRAELQTRRCAKDSQETKEASDAIACIQENAFDRVKEAEKKSILLSQVLHDANIADEKLRLRSACCGVIASKDIFMEATKEKCSKYEKAYEDYVNSYMSEAMGLICPKAEELDCGKLEKLKIDGVELKSKFFLTPMLKVVKTLDNN